MTDTRIGQRDVERLVTKLEEFSAGLDDAEQILLQYLIRRDEPQLSMPDLQEVVGGIQVSGAGFLYSGPKPNLTKSFFGKNLVVEGRLGW